MNDEAKRRELTRTVADERLRAALIKIRELLRELRVQVDGLKARECGACSLSDRILCSTLLIKRRRTDAQIELLTRVDRLRFAVVQLHEVIDGVRHCRACYLAETCPRNL